MSGKREIVLRKSPQAAPPGRVAGLMGLGFGLVLAVSVAFSQPRAAPPASPDLVRRGEGLAAIGGCEGCHTAPGGAPLAGGRPFKTVFGTLYSTNITPDAAHSIGGWSVDDFQRAMNRGVGPHGERYYPVFPYMHFALADRGDLRAIQAWLATAPSSAAEPPPNRLIPPFGFRPLLALWQALAGRPRPLHAQAGLSAQHGATLVAGLGHCGACHTPRNALQAESADRPLAGGEADGWYAPPLQAQSPAPARWTADDLETYLRTGLSDHHQAAAGPMGEVVRSLAHAPALDVRDMAVFLAAEMSAAHGPAPVDRAAEAAADHPQGAGLYAGACASCHEAGAPMRLAGRPSLALGTPLDEDRPTDVVQIVLQGLKPPAGPAGPYMPAFADAFTDAQVAQLTAYLRDRFSPRPPWSGLEEAVRVARKAGGG